MYYMCLTMECLKINKANYLAKNPAIFYPEIKESHD